MPKTEQSFGNQMYHDAASFGRIWAKITAVIVSFIGLIMFIFAIWLMVHEAHLHPIDALCTSDSTMDESHYIDKDGNSHTDMEWKTPVSYNVTNSQGVSVPYQRTVTTTNNYSSGNTVKIFISKSEPGNPEGSKVSSAVPWIIIGITAFMVGMSWLWVYLTGHYEGLAAVGGAMEATRLITGR